MNKKTLHRLSYGLYVISAEKNGDFNGQVANTVFQITSQPPTIAVSINRENLTHEYIHACKRFTVSILDRDVPMDFIGRFGFQCGRDLDKFSGIQYKMTPSGTPVALDYCLGYLEAELEKFTDVETHTIFIGRVIEAELLKEGEPLTYAYYHQVKKGKAPRTAPTYVEEDTADLEEAEGAQEQGSYRCTVCGFVYNPDEGDPRGEVPPGTPFEALPDDWTCPVCGVGKDRFEGIH